MIFFPKFQDLYLYDNNVVFILKFVERRNKGQTHPT